VCASRSYASCRIFFHMVQRSDISAANIHEAVRIGSQADDDVYRVLGVKPGDQMSEVFEVLNFTSRLQVILQRHGRTCPKDEFMMQVGNAFPVDSRISVEVPKSVGVELRSVAHLFGQQSAKADFDIAGR